MYYNNSLRDDDPHSYSSFLPHHGVVGGGGGAAAAVQYPSFMMDQQMRGPSIMAPDTAQGQVEESDADDSTEEDDY